MKSMGRLPLGFRSKHECRGWKAPEGLQISVQPADGERRRGKGTEDTERSRRAFVSGFMNCEGEQYLKIKNKTVKGMVKHVHFLLFFLLNEAKGKKKNDTLHTVKLVLVNVEQLIEGCTSCPNTSSTVTGCSHKRWRYGREMCCGFIFGRLAVLWQNATSVR